MSEDQFKTFDEAMDKILKVPPQVVKDAMEDEKREREKARKAKRLEEKK